MLRHDNFARCRKAIFSGRLLETWVAMHQWWTAHRNLSDETVPFRRLGSNRSHGKYRGSHYILQEPQIPRRTPKSEHIDTGEPQQERG